MPENLRSCTVFLCLLVYADPPQTHSPLGEGIPYAPKSSTRLDCHRPKGSGRPGKSDKILCQILVQP